MTERDSPFEAKELTVSYVVVLSIQGTIPLQVKSNELQGISSLLGAGNFAAIPNGYLVQWGQANQVLCQPPRVQFQGATEAILIDLYTNGNDVVIQRISQKASVAFGVNFQLEVTHKNWTREQIFERMKPQHLNNFSMNGAKFRHKVASNRETNYIIDISASNPDAIVVSANNHIPNVKSTSFSPPELKSEIHSGRESYRNFLTELDQCLQQYQ